MRDYAYSANLSAKTRILNVMRRVFQWPPLERILRDRVQGKDPRSTVGRLVPPEYLYPPGSWRSITMNGLQYRLDLSNATDHGAYFGMADSGDEHFQRLLRPTDVVVDIGANIGIRTLAFARSVPMGRVISFEPHPASFKRLQEHVALNKLTHVQVVNKGIGPMERSERLFEVVSSNSGMNRIVADPDRMGDLPYIEVRIAPLHTELQALGIGHVDAIKLDVEGFEMEVLRGAKEVLERDAPILFIELDDDNLRENRSSAQELLASLSALGYTVVEAMDQAPVRKDLDHCHLDIIATKA
ncbi:MAG: FkbM family methyltransferase [Flavobacteriales bacterium]|nr:FkbM family methyltransferase [Flavobacteriales bacterium]